MKIIGHTVEKLIDPTGILEGERFEYFLHIAVPEDDDLYSENGIKLKVIFAIDNKGPRIASYYFIENLTDKVLDFELEEDEAEMVHNYCKEHIDNA